MGIPRKFKGRDPRTGLWMEVTVVEGLVVHHRLMSDGPPNWIAPGLIDLQVNGFAGYDLNAQEPSSHSVSALTQRLLAEGVTTYVPTLVTSSNEMMAARLEAIFVARKEDPFVAQAVPYVHLEGPHLSEEEGARGVHDPQWIRPPSLKEFEHLQAMSGNLVGLITMSPHYKESAHYITAVSESGVHVAIGHTHATQEQIDVAVEAGARLSTHLGNGAHLMLPRHPNYIWSQLAEDRLTACFIADGHHLPAETLKVMLRAKGLDRSVLVSDSVALAGCAPGRYKVPVGGDVVLEENGRLGRENTGLLAGAARSLSYGVAFAASRAAVGLASALDLATLNPGRFVGHRGELVVGSRADLISFLWHPGDNNLRIIEAVVGGETRYACAAEI